MESRSRIISSRARYERRARDVRPLGEKNLFEQAGGFAVSGDRALDHAIVVGRGDRPSAVDDVDSFREKGELQDFFFEPDVRIRPDSRCRRRSCRRTLPQGKIDHV